MNLLPTVKGNSDKFECIGVGTDAAVFRLFIRRTMLLKCLVMTSLER